MSKLLTAFCLLFGFMTGTTFAQVLEQSALTDPVTIHYYAMVKKNEGCTQATKKTPHPLTKEQCDILLKKHGRNLWVDARNPMMQIIKDPIVYPDDAFAYVSTSTGKGWIFLPR